ncbi:hypothetical protein AB2N04_17755 [Nitratireductor sp. GISD-1A_MAKvit]|uniref:DUF6998 domain-containing protein n=1 Tax=Nitratireductor sp. GISD-1A_MAKvit TaxID=3234198 RepID=UPI0034654899
MSQTLSQTQIIRSLGQALEWFEKEISWGVAPGELNHLTGRIGELYAAMVTRGQMALQTNQRGYDVVSLDGHKISVKTITTSSHVTFKKSTFSLADRVMILRLITDEDEVSIEEILDCSSENLPTHRVNKNGDYTIYLGNISKVLEETKGEPRSSRIPIEQLRKLRETGSAVFEQYKITQFENGSVIVENSGSVEDVAKPILRYIAKNIGVDILNDAGNKKNTRSLGSDIIRSLKS